MFDVLDTKVCLGCEEELPLALYYENPTNSSDGRAARCVPCYKKQVKAYEASLEAHDHIVSRSKERLHNVQQSRATQESTEKQLAMRFNDGKPNYALIPPHLLEGAVRVMEEGAKKYDEWNWTKGLPWASTYSSALRHLASWYQGDTFDEETGQNHIDHAICNLIMLKYFAEAHPELDDRPTMF